jgi:hypothetical protein
VPVSTTTQTISTNAVPALSTNNGEPEYIPIPELHIVTSGNRTVSSGADIAFTARVYDRKGNKRDDAIVEWSFGDGMKRSGYSVFHTYYEAGEYLAIVYVTTADGGDVFSEMIITVKDAGIKITSISSRGIELSNRDSRTLDLSLWKLSMGGQEFKIPEHTQILAGHTIVFSSRVIGLPIAERAFLLYPNGEVATAYPELPKSVSIKQPSSNVVSYKPVQEVESIISTRTDVQNENGVEAPTATIELAAVGAALPAISSETKPSLVSGIFKSPWTLGFIGTVILTSAAFILL